MAALSGHRAGTLLLVTRQSSPLPLAAGAHRREPKLPPPLGCYLSRLEAHRAARAEEQREILRDSEWQVYDSGNIKLL